jgi:DNA repair protein RadD
MAFDLRPYQTAAIKSLYSYFGEHDGNPLIVLPTGTGKSVVIAEFVRGAFAFYPDTRILMVTHVKELIAQNFGALLRMWPDAPAGIYSAGLNSRDLRSPILFCGIQSVHKRAYNIQRCDLVLIDEAHLIPRDSGTMYRRFISELREINPQLKVIGFTATPFRLDSGMLHRGKDAVFDDIAFNANVADMIEEGYLCNLTTKATAIELDVSGVKKRGGEFIASELEAKLDDAVLNAAIAAEITSKGQDRGSWLVFATGVKHAEHLRQEIALHGASAECVFGDTPPGQRGAILDRLKSGDLRCVVNVNVLTTGFDAPGIDLIAMCRPTASTGLYVQMLGRGMRLADGKENCLVLDFARNAIRHGPIDMIDKRGDYDPGAGDGQAPVKTCPTCQEIVFAGCRTCPACGHEFPPPKIDITPKALPAPLLSRELESQWLPVSGCRYSRWTGRDGKPDSMLVEYQSGMMRYREWVCFEHTGYPRQKAAQWWAKRRPGSQVPADVADALERQYDLPCPTDITVQRAGQYFNVVAVKF